MPKQLLKLPFPGVGARLERGRHNAFPARTKGARRAQRPFPFNFPPLLKEKLTPWRLGEPGCVGAAEGTFPFPPERRGPTVKRSGDPRRPAEPAWGPLTRLLNLRRDRAGDARPQDDVQRPQAPEQPPTHGSPRRSS